MTTSRFVSACLACHHILMTEEPTATLDSIGCAGTYHLTGDYCSGHPVYEKEGLPARFLRFGGGSWRCMMSNICTNHQYAIKLISAAQDYPIGSNWRNTSITTECSKLLCRLGPNLISVMINWQVIRFGPHSNGFHNVTS